MVELRYHLLAGSIAGVCESFIMHPSDVLKTQMQSSSMIHKQGVFKFARNMFAAEGLATFYKGLIPVMAVISPKVAL